jgi:hypothetical protein
LHSQILSSHDWRKATAIATGLPPRRCSIVRVCTRFQGLGERGVDTLGRAIV